MNLPIVFIHRGDDDYLAYSLYQAKVSNPNSPVFLLGKAANAKYDSAGIYPVNMDEYMKTAGEFARVYKHIHFMPYDYNLFCFQRWFVLRDFMKRHGIPKCCYIDSDVMLYTDVNNPRFSNFTMEFVWTNFVELDLLESFCQFATNHFRNLTLFGNLISYTQKKKSDHVRNGMPLITDMVMGSLFLEQFPHYQLTYGMYGDAIFDGNIQYTGGMESLDGKKKVYLLDGILYARDMATNKYIRLYSLHFQGKIMKHYMKFFLSPSLPQTGAYFFDYPTCRWVPIS